MAAMNEKDYYEILGVSKDATDEQIRKAFQRKARELHPDVNKAPDAEERFKEVSEAYAVLSDADKKARYDAMRSGSFAGSGWQGGAPSQADPWASDPFVGFGGFGGFGGFPFGVRRQRSGRSRAYNPRAGSNIEFELNLTLKEAREGCKRGITYQHYVVCEPCSGKGSVAAQSSTTCPSCKGTGHIRLDVEDLLGFGVINVECPECEGTGSVISEPCGACGGSGRTISADEIVIEVPAHSHDGDTICIEGRGNAGTNGREAGDFVAHVCIPEERLSHRSARGFQLVGFSAPLLVLEILGGAVGFSIWTAMVLLLGLWWIVKEGLFHRSSQWWRNACSQLVGGFSNGLILVIFIFAMMSCTPRYPRW